VRFHWPTLYFGLGLVLVGGAGMAVASEPLARESDLTAFMRHAADVTCASEVVAGDDLARRLGGRLIEDRVFDFQGVPGRSVHRLALAAGDEVAVVRLFPGGRLRRLTIEYHQAMKSNGTRPAMALLLDHQCRVQEARRIEYDDGGMASNLAVLAPDLTTVQARELLNPPIPGGRDPGGVAVALVDTGINYTLPAFATRLARDSEGRPLGYDFWDMDDRPFDVDPSRSPFFPLHHGTAVASIMAREAPTVRLVPYRFPRPAMARMADVVADADRKGVVIVVLPMGSDDRADWRVFEEAARARPHMLFVVSAGNNGRDIDAAPVYPAALGLDNILTVTSSDAFGRLAPGSNWGRRHVHVMVPGEGLAVIDHRGADGKASGSSFAVPRVAALAARLLARHPEWRAPELKRAILGRARPSRHHPELPVGYGWIPDPTDDAE
jgi:hypothetical protein